MNKLVEISMVIAMLSLTVCAVMGTLYLGAKLWF